MEFTSIEEVQAALRLLSDLNYNLMQVNLGKGGLQHCSAEMHFWIKQVCIEAGQVTNRMLEVCDEAEPIDSETLFPVWYDTLMESCEEGPAVSLLPVEKTMDKADKDLLRKIKQTRKAARS